MKTQNFTFAPFKYSQISFTKKHCIILGLLAIQVMLFLIKKEYTLLLNIAVCSAAILLTNFIATKINKEKIQFDLSMITEAMLIAFCIPLRYNSVALFCIVAAVYFFIKVMFGGFGSNIFSTVACAVTLLYLSFPQYFPQNLNVAELIKPHGNMLSTLQMSGFIKNDKTVTSILNYIFGNIGVVIPEGYAYMLLNNVSTIPAFRYNLLTLASAAVLCAYDIGDKLISFVFLTGYAVSVWIFGMHQIDGSFFSGDMLAAFCTGGIFFYAFFIIGENPTVPHTKIGKSVYGLILAAVTFIICGPGGMPAGAAFAVIGANLCSPVIICIEEKFFTRYLRKHYGTNA